MKPLLSVPLTPEDFWIWDSVVHRCGGEGIAYKLATLHADRRDAALMSWLSLFGHRHYARMPWSPWLPKAAQTPIVHLWLRIDPEWPAGHRLVELT